MTKARKGAEHRVVLGVSGEGMHKSHFFGSKFLVRYSIFKRIQTRIPFSSLLDIANCSLDGYSGSEFYDGAMGKAGCA